MLNKFKKTGKVLYWLVIAVFLFIAVGTTLSVYEAPGGYRMLVVMSGSMEPKIKTGSVVLVKRVAEYKENNIITFLKNPSDNLKDIKSIITHRIIEVHDDEGRATFTVKGDNNDTPDNEMVTERQVLGKVILSIPYAGRAIAFTKTQTGFMMLIVIPAALLIYNEILNIKKEISKMLRKKMEDKESDDNREGNSNESVEEKPEECENEEETNEGGVGEGYAEENGRKEGESMTEEEIKND